MLYKAVCFSAVMASLNYIWFTLLIASTISLVFCEKNEEPSFSGFGFELIQERMDNLQQRFMELSDQLNELSDLFQANVQTVRQNQNTIISMISSLTKKFEDKQISLAPPDKISSKNLQNSKQNVEISQDHPPVKLTKSCKEANSTSNGLYEISEIDGLAPFTVWCQMESFEGEGWLVFQRRINGSVDFFRNWTEYRNGFGDVAGEYWLGLERIHQLTREGTWQLLVEMADFQDNRKYAHYSVFSIGSETQGYPLVKLGSYSGTAGDYLKYHKGMKFSTLDRDNDADRRNCAQTHHGAWWFKNCLQSNLNGKHKSKLDYETIKWHAGLCSLKHTLMMIKPMN